MNALNEDGSQYIINNQDQKSDLQASEYTYGLSNFEFLGTAFFAIFYCVFGKWTMIYEIYEESNNSALIVLYFVSCVAIFTFIFLNIVTAQFIFQYA
jgi:TRAP-type mannitol/chloroaromatic compound transport system permease small subunit